MAGLGREVSGSQGFSCGRGDAGREQSPTVPDVLTPLYGPERGRLALTRSPTVLVRLPPFPFARVALDTIATADPSVQIRRRPQNYVQCFPRVDCTDKREK